MVEFTQKEMERRMMQAAEDGNINHLYAIMQQDYRIFDHFDERYFVDTPLHAAAAAGNSHFAIELLNLRPSFATKLNQGGFSPMHLALQNQHFNTVKRLVHINPGLVRVKGRDGLTPLHYAVELENVEIIEMFLSKCPQSITDRTTLGETALHLAVNSNKVNALKFLLEWVKLSNETYILSWEDGEGNTLLHLAIPTPQVQDPMSQLLHASQVGNVDDLYAIIKEQPGLLERVSKKIDVDTPLHIAIVAGHSQFCKELMNLSPSLTRRLNQDRLSPLHLAVLHNRIDIAHNLIKTDSKLVREKGKDGLTPFHCAVQMGTIDILLKLFEVCPYCISDTSYNGETALHIAVRCNNFDVFNILMNWIKQVNQENILGYQDWNGNTVLHTATARNQLQVVKLLLSWKSPLSFLLYHDYIGLNDKNLEGETALDVFERQREATNVEIGIMLRTAGALRASSLSGIKKLPSNFTTERRMSSDERNAILVVAVLIATTAYQTAVTPIGGVWQDNNPSEGNHHLKLAGKTMVPGTFLNMMFLNSIAFYSSVLLISCNIPTGARSCLLLHLPLYFLSVSYADSLMVVSRRVVDLNGLPILCFILSFMVIFKMILWSLWFDPLDLSEIVKGLKAVAWMPICWFQSQRSVFCAKAKVLKKSTNLSP